MNIIKTVQSILANRVVFVAGLCCLGISQQGSAQVLVKMNTRLYAVGSASPADGNVVVFDTQYSNDVDGDDALKLATSAENFGIQRKDKILVVEGRQPITDKDTLSFIMWNMALKDYRIDFTPQNLHPNLTALLVDSFLHTTEALDLSQPLISKTFTVTSDSLSGGGGNRGVRRFAIFFAQIPPLPVTFLSISANKRNNGVEVSWKVAEERGIAKYEIQRSSDGRSFKAAGTVTATGSTSYAWKDGSPLGGNSFYRIKAISVDGQIKFTNIAKVFAGNINPGISVYPNPVESGIMNLQFVNEVKGRFEISLINDAGQVMYKDYAEHDGGNTVHSVILPASVARGGTYRLITISPEKIRTVQQIFINSTK